MENRNGPPWYSGALTRQTPPSGMWSIPASPASRLAWTDTGMPTANAVERTPLGRPVVPDV